MSALQDFGSQLLCLLVVHIRLLLQLGIAHGHDLFEVCHLLVEVLVPLLQVVGLLTQLIYIVEEGHILLLCLDEGGHYFVDAGDSRSLHYGLKGFLDYLGIPHVLIQQPPLLFILVR